MRRGEIYRVARPRDDPKKFRAFVDNLVSLAKADLTNFVGTLPVQKAVELNRALKAALDLP